MLRILEVKSFWEQLHTHLSPQICSSKASILWVSAFFIVQLSHTYMTTGKTIALTRQTFVGTVMSLLFNMMSRLVIDLLSCSSFLQDSLKQHQLPPALGS